MWFLLLACSDEPASARLVRALHAVEAHDPTAWAQCEALTEAQGQGMCLDAAAAADPDRAAACPRIASAEWRGECWFELAEKRAAAKDLTAVEACTHAEMFVDDCARHVWWEASLAGTATPELRAELERAFPHLAAELAAGDQDRVRAEMIAAGATPTTGSADGKGESLRARFRRQPRIDPSECTDVACAAAARTVFVDRWTHAIERQPDLLGRLCGGATPPPRLDPGADPGLRAALDGLRAERCR